MKLQRSAEIAPTGDQLATFRSTYDASDQPYRLYVPTSAGGSSALPLAIVLHGYGVDHNAWFDLTTVKQHAESRGYILAAPFARGNWWYRGPAEQDVLDIISDAKSRCEIDPERIYLMGHSMGGWGTWRIAARHPHLFATICPMAAPAPTLLIENCGPLNPMILHDSEDEIVPVACSRGAAAQLGAAGFKHRYIETSGYGHSSSLISDSMSRVFDWFGEHRRKRAPETVTLKAPFRCSGSAFWLHLLESETLPGRSALEASCCANGRLNLKTERVLRAALDLQAFTDRPKYMIVNESEKVELPAHHYAVLNANLDGTYAVSFSDELPESKKPQIVASLPPELSLPQNLDLLAQAAARLLREESGAEVCLLDTDSVRMPPGDLNEEQVMDLYVAPDDVLVSFEYDGKPLELQTGSALLKNVNAYPAVTPLQGRKMAAIAPRMICPGGKILPVRVGELMLNAVRHAGKDAFNLSL
jgi:predicted esterase